MRAPSNDRMSLTASATEFSIFASRSAACFCSAAESALSASKCWAASPGIAAFNSRVQSSAAERRCVSLATSVAMHPSSSTRVLPRASTCLSWMTSLNDLQPVAFCASKSVRKHSICLLKSACHCCIDAFTTSLCLATTLSKDLSRAVNLKPKDTFMSCILCPSLLSIALVHSSTADNFPASSFSTKGGGTHNSFGPLCPSLAPSLMAFVSSTSWTWSSCSPLCASSTGTTASPSPLEMVAVSAVLSSSMLHTR
mmetsp:Transcript_75832/g.190780  ORF Transcript_75832/g.190780 Transcript_75832/m.190780 type:complete len:254 (+) Transcript_75832:2416-3177(+)